MCIFVYHYEYIRVERVFLKVKLLKKLHAYLKFRPGGGCVCL